MIARVPVHCFSITFTKDEIRIYNCDKLQQHDLRMMGMVDKCISRLDETSKLGASLHELDHTFKHVTLNIRIDYLDVSILNYLLSTN